MRKLDEVGEPRAALAAALNKVGPLHLEAADIPPAIRLRCQSVARRQNLLTNNISCSTTFLLVEGWCCEEQVLLDGRRQVTALYTPGDLMGLRHLVGGASLADIVALKAARVVEVEVSMQEALKSAPSVLQGLFFAAVRELNLASAHLSRLGRRTATERIAHLFLELHERCRLAQKSVGALNLPLTQETLSDVLGLSLVHVNRTLQILRKEELIQFTGSRLRILDEARLREVADFDDRYLRRPTFHEALSADYPALRAP